MQMLNPEPDYLSGACISGIAFKEGENMKEEHRHKHEETCNAAKKTEPGEEKKVEDNISSSEKEIKKLSEELAKAKEEALLSKDKALRAMADLNNAAKRQKKEKEDFVKYAAGELAVKIIPALDDFEQALKGEIKVDENFSKGVMMIYNNLKEALEKEGLKKHTSRKTKNPLSIVNDTNNNVITITYDVCDELPKKSNSKSAKKVKNINNSVDTTATTTTAT